MRWRDFFGILRVETGQFVDFFDRLPYAGSGQIRSMHGSAAVFKRDYCRHNHHLGTWACVDDGVCQFPFTRRVIF
jgi:hypothetical protein